MSTSRLECFGKRSWIKLWTTEWLDGTTRYEMSDSQRAFWIDLLAMAGRSRFPGNICAGYNQGQFVGYPLSRFQALMAGPIDVEATFALFERTDRIKTEITSVGPPKLYKLELLNWTKYQSEYQRLKKYRRQKYTESTRFSTVKVTLQKEKDSYRQTEIEKEKQFLVGEASAASPDDFTAASTDQRTLLAFQSMQVKPFGPQSFQQAWTAKYELIPDNNPSSFVEAMESTIQICVSNEIKVPSKFFDLKRAIEKIEVKHCFQRTPL